MTEALNPRWAVYPGTFDPVHRGHLDIIERGVRIYDRLVVAVGVNPDKTPFFSGEERLALLREVTAKWPKVEIRAFEGLTVQFVRQVEAKIILRGLRSTTDMEYEFNMSMMNRGLDTEIETVFLMAREEYSHVSSTLLRQIAMHEGNLSRFLPESVEKALLHRARQRRR